MKTFSHYNARSVREAADLLKRHGGKARLNAGGTDLLGSLKGSTLSAYPEVVVNLKRIEGLDYIRQDEEGLRIGALTKLAGIAASDLVREGYGALADAARSVATPQVRNMATIGGNIAQDVRCWYYRYPRRLGGPIVCIRKGGAFCNALSGDNRYHSLFGGAPLASYPCASHCPASTAIPSYMARARSGDFKEASAVLADFNPLAAITGRVCPTFCEPECRRGELDEPVAIRCVERAIGDYMLGEESGVYGTPASESGRAVAVVGSGPSGLAAAYYLRRYGHRVTVFERLPEPGGMPMYTIPAFRLAKDVVRRQVAALSAMGVSFECGTDVDGKALSAIGARFDAVLLACGAWKEKRQGMKGEELVISGLDFLKRVNEGDGSLPGKRVAVIGGGNAAIDVARTLLRLGAKPVVLYRRSRKEMPAFKADVEEALAEGVRFRFLTSPVAAARTDSGIELSCEKMRLGAPDASGRRRPVRQEGKGFSAVFDAVIKAIGEEPGDEPASPSRLSGPRLFAAGDFVTGPSTVAAAVASGREAARRIDLSLVPDRKEAVRSPSPTSPSFQRTGRIAEGKGEDGALPERHEIETEAARCFNCGCLAVSPSDVATVLLALDATIVTTKRSIDAGAFFRADATASTVIEPDEVITEIRVPRPPEGARQAYLKFTLRKPVDFAVVGVACVITARDGRCADARIALGAVGPAPLRAFGAEEALRGRPLTENTAVDAAEAAVAGAEPLAMNGYKVEITRALVKRAILGRE